VTRGEVHPAAGEEALARFDGRDPPDPAQIDLSGLVDVHANERGLPEYTVRTSSGPQSKLIQWKTR